MQTWGMRVRVRCTESCVGAPSLRAGRPSPLLGVAASCPFCSTAAQARAAVDRVVRNLPGEPARLQCGKLQARARLLAAPPCGYLRIATCCPCLQAACEQRGAPNQQ